MDGTLCGVWIDGDGVARVSLAAPDGAGWRRRCPYQPFAPWMASDPFGAPVAGVTFRAPRGNSGPRHPWQGRQSLEAFEGMVKTARESVAVDAIRPLESQFLLQHRARLYGDMPFTRLRRCQLDIETGSGDGGFSNAERPDDRVLAIGMRTGTTSKLLLLEEMTDEAEKRLLQSFNAALAAADPDVIEGHNIFKFDLDYLRARCRMRRVPCAWGRFGQKATFRNSRLKVAERWVDFPRCDLPGRAVIDTYLLALLNDITTRELNSYGSQGGRGALRDNWRRTVPTAPTSRATGSPRRS